MARSTLDLLKILRRVTDAGAEFRCLKDPWADTTTPHRELMTTVLAGLATFERHMIKARTDEGVKAARARGVRFGRPPKLTPFQRQEAIQRLADGESQADVARAYNVNPAAICRPAAASALCPDSAVRFLMPHHPCEFELPDEWMVRRGRQLRWPIRRLLARNVWLGQQGPASA
jgi:hypothetical protein